MDNYIRVSVPSGISGNFLQGFYAGQDSARKEILKAPTIDAEPVRHGQWVIKKDRSLFWANCSECGYIQFRPYTNYCPNCAAKMDMEREE